MQDYVGAESLDLAVREHGAAPPSKALRVAAQLADALDFTAAVNIFHGALHPRDVLLSSDEARLTGVGIARALEQVGVTAPVRRPYTAPERMAGASWDRRADVFSLAAMLHELLWARRVSGLGLEAAAALPPIAGSDPTALRAAFGRALAENPAERFATALEFAEALTRAFPEVTVSSAPVTATPSSKRGSRMELEPRLPLSVSEDSASEEKALSIFGDDAPLKPPAVRYDDVDASPLVTERHVSVEEVAVAGPVGLITGHDPNASSTLDRARSAVWPLVLALTVGLAMGFAGGYGVGSHDRAPVAAAPAGREFTESAVAEAPKKDTERVSSGETRKPDTTSTVAKSNAATSQAAPSTNEAGRLLIRSTPPGASVSVDGREYGKTPATVRDLARGPHQVRVTREGYAALERRVVISSSRPAQPVNVALVRTQEPPPSRPAAPPAASSPASAATGGRVAGALVVDSRPMGARVYLDGQLIGSTPLSLQSVAAGDHVVRLELDGYRNWSSSVRILAAENNRVTASLER